jgi:hypothetical protein
VPFAAALFGSVLGVTLEGIIAPSAGRWPSSLLAPAAWCGDTPLL